MKRKYSCPFILIAIIGILLLTSCTKSNQSSDDMSSKIAAINKKFTYNSTAKYDLYIGLLGNVGYVQINDINNGKIDYNNPYIFNFKKKGKNVGDLSSNQSRVFASIHDDSHNGVSGNTSGMTMGNKVAVINKNNIANYIEFPKYDGLSDIMLDVKNHKAYVMCSVQPSRYNPSGTPFVTFDTKTNKQQTTINIKGIPAGYGTNGNYIYMAISDAKKLGYTDVPNSYIATLDRTTNKMNVLIPMEKNKIKDMSVGKKRLFLLIKTPQGNDNLDIYDLNGRPINQISLTSKPNHIVLNEQGLLYMSHIGSQYDGKNVTVFDTKTDKVLTDIQGFVGAGSMVIKDHYLFVDNEGSALISVVDMNTNKMIGTIDFGLQQGSHGLAMVKNK